MISLWEQGADILFLNFDANIDTFIGELDAVLLPGGEDLLPSVYNQEKHHKTYCHNSAQERVSFEKKLLERLSRKMPILGICYGAQLLNVLHGGNLCQHIDNHEEHDQKTQVLKVQDGS